MTYCQTLLRQDTVGTLSDIRQAPGLIRRFILKTGLIVVIFQMGIVPKETFGPPY